MYARRGDTEAAPNALIMRCRKSPHLSERAGSLSVLIVPRGFHADYYEFLALTARTNGDVLVVDRRRFERRRSTRARPDDRRDSDRRGPPPVTWERDGLIVLANDSAQQAAPRRQA
jgi:hypothetical protein